MEKIRELQAQAREFERMGQHAAALELYGRILEEPAGDREGSVWARAASMRLALGREAEAVESYAAAVDRYAEAGLHNLALSYCQRLLRLDDSRTEALLRFGRLAAGRGYSRDARHGFVEYADRIAAAGDVDGAVAALREYLRVFASDTAVRRRVTELTGEEEPEEPAQPLGMTEGALPGLLTHADEPASAPPGHRPETQPGASDQESGGLAPLEGFEPTNAGETWGGGEPPAPPMLDWPQSRAGEEGQEEDEGEGEGAEPLPLLGVEPEQRGTGDLPPLYTPPEAPPETLPSFPPTPITGGGASVDPLERARQRVMEDPTSVSARRDLVALLRSRNDPGLASALVDAEQVFASGDRHADALEFVEQLARLRPDDTALQQRRVERALLAGNRAALVAAYLALAARHEAELDTAKARDSLRKVLELDPANEEARAALGSATAAAAPPRDYIDLGELVLADAPDAVTRFQVAIGEPTGDEESDFAEILDLFRKKVSESLDPKDAASHYDLGLAFKEMGLLDDAIVHLQSALRGGASPLATLEVLGQCFVLKGQLSLAARVFERATRLEGVGDSDLVGVRYGLARCQEDLDQAEEARSNYERVVSVDLSFRDAAARLAALDSR